MDAHHVLFMLEKEEETGGKKGREEDLEAIEALDSMDYAVDNYAHNT